ncbi:PaaI family thioesterase [Chloroflexota bacterium]
MVKLPQLSIDTERVDQCFGCGKNNPIGLKLSFQWDGKSARTEFTPAEVYQGWLGVVHGGIVMAMLDEAVSYAAFFEGMSCVTAEMQARLKRPALVGEPLIITGIITKKTRRFIEAKATICLKDGTLVAEGEATQVVIEPKREDKSKRNGKPKSDA